jgi:hypothetical protein
MFLLNDNHYSQDGQSQSSSMRKVAKMALLLACAGTTEAFQPSSVMLRSPASKAISVNQNARVPLIPLRERAANPAAVLGLKAQVTDAACREKMYETAQASHQ